MLLRDFQKARELFEQLERVSEIVKDLKAGKDIIFRVASMGGEWIPLPEVIKGLLVTYYEGIIETVQTQIDSL